MENLKVTLGKLNMKLEEKLEKENQENMEWEKGEPKPNIPQTLLQTTDSSTHCNPSQTSESRGKATAEVTHESMNDQVSESRDISESRDNKNQNQVNPKISESRATQVQDISSQTEATPQQGVLSQEYPGLIENPDGTFIMTKQYKAWHRIRNIGEGKIPSLQLEKTYPNWTGTHPIGYPEDPKLDKTWHPPPTKLDLVYSHLGSWVRVPKRKDDRSGPNYKEFNIARMEVYIDQEGNQKYAICYKRIDKDLHIWFDEEEMKEAFDNWVIPELPYYYNTRKYDGKLRKEYQGKEEEEKKQTQKTEYKKPHPARQSNADQEDRNRKDRQDDDYWDRINQQALREMWGDTEKDRWTPPYGRGSTPHGSSGNDPRDPRDQRGSRDTRGPRGSRDEPRDPRDSMDSRDSDNYEAGARSHPQREKRKRDNSRDRYRQEYRDSSWDRNRDRRHADRSNSRERKDDRDADRDRRPSYGRRGR